ncbi:unnamed protein product, partial [Cylicocyclus nassatus]
SFDCAAHHAPPSQSSLEYSEEVNTWLRDELEHAEVIPMRKPENPSHLHASSSNQSLKLISDSALMLEIELLKAQIRAQSSTFEGHEIQLAKLQEKLSELQSRQGLFEKSEPPPEYISQMQSPISHMISKACVIL